MKRIVTCAVEPFESTTSRFSQCVPGRVGRPRSYAVREQVQLRLAERAAGREPAQCPDAAGSLEPAVESALPTRPTSVALHLDDERRLLRLRLRRRCRRRRCERVEDRLVDERRRSRRRRRARGGCSRSGTTRDGSTSTRSSRARGARDGGARPPRARRSSARTPAGLRGGSPRERAGRRRCAACRA